MDINAALIGCGRIGFLLENDPLRKKPCTHFGGAKAAGIRITHACDINSERLAAFAKLANIPAQNAFADYKTLLQTIKPQCVIIATWTDSHAQIGALAAQNGCKVIICEKPIAANLADAQMLIAECKRNSTSLIINHERRYDARYNAVKKLITSGKIGEIKTVHASILTSGYHGNSDIREGGGPLLHDGTHLVDIIRFFFGEIHSVSGAFSRDTRTKGYEDKAVAWLKTESSIDVFLEAGGSRKYFVFELAISGTQGKIVIGNGYEHLHLNAKSKYYTGFYDLSEVKFPKPSGINYFKKEYIEAKKILEGNEVKITSSGYDGYKALEAIHAIYYSASKNKKWIDLPIKPNKINLKKIFNL